MLRFRSQLFAFVDVMSRRQKQFSLLMIDVVLAPLAFYLTCAVVFGSVVPKAMFDSLFVILCLLGFAIGRMAPGRVGFEQ